MTAARFELLEELQDDLRVRRWRAFDRNLECEVLVESPGPEVLEHLTGPDGDNSLRDARMLARITHPNVVRLREVATDENDAPLLVLDPPVGECLADVLVRETTLPPATVTTTARDLAAAAQAVHAAGVVHRGIAGGNVYLDTSTGHAVLTGFTFAKPLSGRMGLTSLHHDRRNQNDAPIALPDYAAPEQVRGKAADHRADVFALGCLLYRCLTGVEAFADGDVEKPPPSARERRPEVPKRLSDLVQRCLLPVPTARFPNMNAVVAELNALEAESASPPPSTHRVRNLLVTGVAAVGTLTATLLWSDGEDSGHALTEFARGAGRVHAAEAVAGLEPTYATSWAVLIGTDYRSPGNSVPELDNAERDVEALKRSLLGLGWETDKVTTLVGPSATRQNIVAALSEVRKGAEPNDQVFLYFAGHGTPNESNRHRLVLVPDQGVAGDGSKGLRVSNLIDDFITGEEFAAKHVLLALDCCHAGLASTAPSRSAGIDPDDAPDSDAPTRYADRESLRRRARWILASSQAHEVATDGENDHSPFAQAFLDSFEGLGEGDSLTHTEVFAAIQKAYRTTNSGQLPWLRGTEGCGAEFLFLR